LGVKGGTGRGPGRRKKRKIGPRDDRGKEIATTKPKRDWRKRRENESIADNNQVVQNCLLNVKDEKNKKKKIKNPATCWGSQRNQDRRRGTENYWQAGQEPTKRQKKTRRAILEGRNMQNQAHKKKKGKKQPSIRRQGKQGGGGGAERKEQSKR